MGFLMSPEYFKILDKLKSGKYDEEKFKQALRDNGWSEKRINNEWEMILEDPDYEIVKRKNKIP
jgi:hypothetical protein